ncbi:MULTISPECIES: glutamate decarboxylase [Mycobacteriaceae]|uniref:Glutamate decarboxylase n=1 Tax=Mycolicibacterium parafortuitum TaxID=39692 RepID=A0ACC6MHT6_MYCPF|nr:MULTISPECIES: glutamate decarboxylase [Mycobacteriaceae]MBX7446848.1 glutamate decarboxylase [Mycolicibacterium aurantiacum]MEC9323198.1 glutamate decarboxylase [Actinomycetota bacterium]MDZ5086499.1 glutamate decarboxylase [Mycolicibacterium parafortuitum]GFM17112.1 glutamate decarboxylase gadB [Mycobacterium sp. PO1]GFM23405.1 glutamate decarboxylase gadB [Mycobacterium sp. PO2]
MPNVSRHSSLTPAYTGRMSTSPIPALRLPDESLDPENAYRFIHDELMLDGSSRLNLATFVTTWMDPEAGQLMSETFDKNMIDKDEYPVTAAIEQRCVCMVADLFHAEDLRDDDPSSATGVSTVGSSEAVMLAGLAMKWRWRERAGSGEGRDWKNRTPNLVMGSNVQVVWEKFCRYFDVEARYLPMEEGRYVITPEQVVDAVDENTIGVVAILGTTFTGELEPVGDICAALDKLAADGGCDVPVHVDAASGGFVVPFLHPDVVWDFRLPRVVSINVSGHKYGLTYPGIGFVVWRNAEHLPEDLVFRVNYLGGDMPTFTLNFSRPGNQVVGQYYNFLRLGRDGYLQVMRCLSENAQWLAHELAGMTGPDRKPVFEVISDGSAIPVVAFKLVDGIKYTVFDVSALLRGFGWQVPAYTMPDDAADIAVLRIVVREGFSANLARALRDDLVKVLDKLDAIDVGGFADEAHFAH